MERNYDLLDTKLFELIIFDRIPIWFADDPDLKYFKRFFQTNFKDFQVSESSEITIHCKDWTGHPGGKMLKKWFVSTQEDKNIDILRLIVKRDFVEGKDTYSILGGSHWKNVIPCDIHRDVVDEVMKLSGTIEIYPGFNEYASSVFNEEMSTIFNKIYMLNKKGYL